MNGDEQAGRPTHNRKNLHSITQTLNLTFSKVHGPELGRSLD